MTQTERPRAALATADITLIKRALGFYMNSIINNEAEIRKISNIMHRLGRIE